MLNTVSLAGRIAQTPVLQRTSGDAAYVRFSIACDRDYRQADRPISFPVWLGVRRQNFFASISRKEVP